MREAARAWAEAGADSRASKMPRETAVNMVLERRKASMRSRTGVGSGMIHILSRAGTKVFDGCTRALKKPKYWIEIRKGTV